MPEVKKQLPPKALKKASINGESVLARAIPASEIETDYLKFVIYGQNRIGKTTLACQFPKPLLLITFEPSSEEQSGGARSIKKIPGVTYVSVQSTADAEILRQELVGNHIYKSHVLDGMTNYERMHLSDILGDPDLTQQITRARGISKDDYTERSERVKNGLRKFLNLPAHTILCCREKDHQPPKDQFQPRMMRGLELESFFASDLGGGAVGWLHDTCDFITQLYLARQTKDVEKETVIAGKSIKRTETLETGRQVRRLRTTLDKNYAAGFRSENPEAVPEYIEAVTPEQMYQAIVDVIAGKKTKYGHYLNNE